jgi:hypothetical protein
MDAGLLFDQLWDVAFRTVWMNDVKARRAPLGFHAIARSQVTSSGMSARGTNVTPMTLMVWNTRSTFSTWSRDSRSKLSTM